MICSDCHFSMKFQRLLQIIYHALMIQAAFVKPICAQGGASIVSAKLDYESRTAEFVFRAP